MTVLIVEEEYDLSDILAFIFRRAGHHVLLASDGESALQLWQENQPELVLLDLGLAKMMGWEVCQRIRSQTNTPVIMVSESDAEADIIKGFELGIEDYIVKPFSPRILMARVNAVLKHATSENAPNHVGAAVERENSSSTLARMEVVPPCRLR